MAAMWVISGCGKPEGDSRTRVEPQTALAAKAPTGEPTQVGEVRAKSGIQMVYLPAGEFAMGHPRPLR